MANEEQTSDHRYFNGKRLLPSKRRFSQLGSEQQSMHADETDTVKKLSGSNSNESLKGDGRHASRTSIAETESIYDPVDSLRLHNSQEIQPESSPEVEDNNKKDSQGSNPYNSLNINSHSTFSQVLAELGQESKMVMLQYSQTLSDSELYEKQSLQAVSDLAAHAKVLEQNLNHQKEELCRRLKMITQKLKTEH